MGVGEVIGDHWIIKDGGVVENDGDGGRAEYKIGKIDVRYKE